MTAPYIALEGIDGAGKSTVVSAIVAEFKRSGQEVVSVLEPGGTWIGEQIRQLLLSVKHPSEPRIPKLKELTDQPSDRTETPISPWAEALLFAAQRAQLVEEIISPALADQQWVVSDRSFYSSLIYQGIGRGLGVEAVRELNEMATSGVVPGLVIVLDIDPRLGASRQFGGALPAAGDLEFLTKIREGYRELAGTESAVELVSAEQPASDLVDQVMNLIQERWN